MRVGILALWGVLLVGCDACRDETADTSLPVLRAEPTPDVIAPRTVATDHAFDLVRVGDGVAFIWSPPFTEGGGVRLIRLDAMGSPLASEQAVFAPRGFDEHPPDAFEVRAAAGGGRLAVAWVQREPFARGSFVAFGPDSGEAFSPPEQLADLSRETDPIGGVVVAAADDGTLSVMYRGRDGPCPAGTEARRARERCAQLGFRRVGSDATSDERGLPLAVPTACRRPLVGYVVAGGAWHYALCSGSAEARSTTMYAIDFEPPYAHAEEGLLGATPVGLAPYDEGAIVLGESSEGIEALVMKRAGREVERLSSVRRRVRCDEGSTKLVLQTADGDRELALAEPIDGLAPWLPALVAPPLSRAAWTGEALLVATAADGDVAIHRYQCRFGRLDRTDML